MTAIVCADLWKSIMSPRQIIVSIYFIIFIQLIVIVTSLLLQAYYARIVMKVF